MSGSRALEREHCRGPGTNTFFCFLCKRHVGQEHNAYLHVKACPKAAKGQLWPGAAGGGGLPEVAAPLLAGGCCFEGSGGGDHASQGELPDDAGYPQGGTDGADSDSCSTASGEADAADDAHLAKYLGAVLMQDAGGARDADELDVVEDELPDVQSHATGSLGHLQAMPGHPLHRLEVAMVAIYDFFMVVRRSTFTRAYACSCVGACRSSRLALTCCGLRRTLLRWR